MACTDETVIKTIIANKVKAKLGVGVKFGGSEAFVDTFVSKIKGTTGSGCSKVGGSAKNKWLVHDMHWKNTHNVSLKQAMIDLIHSYTKLIYPRHIIFFFMFNPHPNQCYL